VKIKRGALFTVLAIAGLLLPAKAQINLGSAANYGVLAGSTITNTGLTIVNGDLGLYPGTSVTGSPTVNGAINVDNAFAEQAEADLASAYTAAHDLTPTFSNTNSQLGGQTLTPGVYNFGSSVDITGTLTLSGNGLFVFQVGTALTAEGNSQITLTNGAQADDVFWEIGSSATLIGASSTFDGTVLASASITVDAGATVNGDLLAESGAVTLDADNITAIPEPADAALLISGFFGILVLGAAGVREMRRQRTVTT